MLNKVALWVMCFSAAACQTVGQEHRPAVDQAEIIVLQKAGADLSCQGRISVSEAGSDPHRIMAEGCGRQAAYQMDCKVDDAQGCKTVHRL